MRLAATIASLAPTAVCALALPSASLDWHLPPHGARIEGSTLIAELAPGDPTNAVHCEAPLDLSGLLGDGRGLVLSIRLRADGVTKPAHEWNGVKFMLRYQDADTGRTHFPGASAPIGTYGWRTVTNRVNILTAPVNPVDGRATLVLGLQESTGRVEFDLDSLTIESEASGIRRENADVLSCGEYVPVRSDKGVFSFRRVIKSGAIYVVANRSEFPLSLDKSAFDIVSAKLVGEVPPNSAIIVRE